MDANDDPNPALGWRSIRVGLDRPGMLRQQLQAMLHAAAGQDLYVMFPMIAEVAEFKKALRVLEMEHARMDGHIAEPPAKVFVGAMLEVPGLVWQLDALLPSRIFCQSVVTIFSSLCLPQTEESKGFRPLRRSLARHVRRYQGCRGTVLFRRRASVSLR